MGGTPADSTTTTAFMTMVSIERAPITAAMIMPLQKPSQQEGDATTTTIALPALMLLEMEDNGDSSSCCCDEESSVFSSLLSSISLPSLRKVGFASVVVREYTVTIGDHPCCTQGCPLTLDWEYQQGPALALEAFETSRVALRRHRNDLRTTWEERRHILSQECSEGELRKAQRKLHRARSCNSRLCEKMSDAFFNSSSEGN